MLRVEAPLASITLHTLQYHQYLGGDRMRRKAVLLSEVSYSIGEIIERGSKSGERREV